MNNKEKYPKLWNWYWNNIDHSFTDEKEHLEGFCDLIEVIKQELQKGE